jgi:hypothetical protein
VTKKRLVPAAPIRPGAILVLLAHLPVQGAGFAESYCYACLRPEEFGHVGKLLDLVALQVDVQF